MQNIELLVKKLYAIYISLFLLAITFFVSCETSEELLHPYDVERPLPRGCVDSNLFTTETQVSQDEIVDLKRAYKDSKYADYLKEKYAGLMHVTPDHIQSLMLYTFIDYWYGTHYRLGGNDKMGIDCSAFAQKLYTTVFGIDLVRTSREQFSSCRFVKEEEKLMEGDLVFFRVKGKRISHVGVYLMNSYFIHSATNGGVMISSLNDDYYRRRFAGAGYIPKYNKTN